MTGDQGRVGGDAFVIRVPGVGPGSFAQRGCRALTPPRPRNWNGPGAGEDGLARPVVLVPGQRPGVRATACGPLSAGGGGLRVCVPEAVIWGASGAQDREALGVCAGQGPAGLPRLDWHCVRIYASDLRPQQDANLRSRLRRPLACIALTSANMVADGPAGRVWGAARQSFGALARRCWRLEPTAYA
jgi:hypothetical protein